MNHGLMTASDMLRQAQRNVIVLTSGLTGSSVLTGFLARAGYWTGDTYKKKQYDTFENSDLIELNRRIFREAGFTGDVWVLDAWEDYWVKSSDEVIQRIGSVADSGPCQEFIDKCSNNQPWIWKDPRLSVTIHFWKNRLDLHNCKFIVLTRGYRQMWTSKTLRGQNVNYLASKAYERSVKESAIRFLEQECLPFLTVSYENLIVRPIETIKRLNDFLDTNLSVDDLAASFRYPLYKLPDGSNIKFLKAVGVCLWNSLVRPFKVSA